MKKIIYTLILALAGSNLSNAQVNYIDSYIGSTVTLTTIASNSNQLNQPRDLDFKPNSNELWIVNYANSGGGTTVIIYDAGLPTQSSEFRHDTHSDHFMMYPSAIAFGNDGKWATSTEIKSTGSATSTFMGPALWSADTAIYARVFQNNWLTNFPLGSHLDMLHQSPFCMGIAHDTAMAYWVMDGYNGNICKYDFVQHHGPGYDNHSAGKIWRYTDVPVTRVVGVPSHMVLDKQSGWLYFIDGLSKTVKRLNTNTGSVTGGLTTPSTAQEPLAGYYKVEGVTVEVIDSLQSQPCGIEFYNGRLLVGDYTTGNIYLYDIANSTYFRDTVVTGHPGMMGIKVGPDGHIWCVNKTDNKVYRLDVASPQTDAAITHITSPTVQNYLADFYSASFDVCSGSITPSIEVTNNGLNAISDMEIHYTINSGTPVTFNWTGNLAAGSTTSINLPASSVTNGAKQIDVMIILVNGATDDVDLNNQSTGAFRVISPAMSIPFTEGFTAVTFPPAGFNYIHYNTTNFLDRNYPGGFGNSSGCAKMDNFSGQVDITGQKDYLLMPAIDFSSASANAVLQFSVAYAQYNSSSNDQLQVLASVDCGESWSVVYTKSGIPLATTSNYSTSSWTPVSTEWRTETVLLNGFSGQSELMLAFNPVSNWGNNLYFDDIFVGESNVGIAETNFDFSAELFPNPSNSDLYLILNNTTAAVCSISITDVLGKQIAYFSTTINNGKNEIDLTDYFADCTQGCYFVSLKTTNTIINKKIIRN